MGGMLASAWRFRHFIISSIVTEFRLRFARSRLGGFWMILHPLTQVMMYALILSSLLSAKLPGIVNNKHAYAIYLTAGILAWSLFTEVINRCLTLFIDNGNLMKKAKFPKITLPLIVTGIALVNNVLLLAAILAIFTLLGHFPGAAALWLPILMAITLAFGLGLGLILGVLNVFLRDIGQLVPVLLQLGFWFTPIAYMTSIIPENYRGWMTLNPMYHIVENYQSVLVFNHMPDGIRLAVVGLLSLLALALALFLFRKAAPELVDVL
ncbi:MAG: ABC transporter permease [Deltaproteobacteria bacterium]|nr:ABC transporter permease [Deltaproteobacteria bacterium]